MYYYDVGGTLAASALPSAPFPAAPEGRPALFLLDRDPGSGRAAFRVTDPRQLTASREDVSWLSPDRMDAPAPKLPAPVAESLAAGTLTAVNLRHPRWQDALDFLTPRAGKKRLNLLAVGDVGSTVLTALKLLGGDCLASIGICDLNEKTVQRWTAEMGQVACPWDYDAFPGVEPVDLDHLFECDVFLFIATRSIPAVGSDVKDVRMAQFEANRSIVEHYARMARSVHYRGLFLVMSDPVDPLCKAAWLASNTGEDGTPDHLGLLPEQVQGLGLGVMNARAAYYAKKDDRFADFLTEGRAFGPHGSGLVIANSIAHYDDSRSRELTELALTANLKMRELGFKPYAA
ncbi:lactate dehydrogenase, partial [Dysosmobacter sp.]|uniref:lactate dehydrogenase n=1 Tax=Dysosmobacter sp. TaxID=2591382 RepID=UPI002A8D043D